MKRKLWTKQIAVFLSVLMCVCLAGCAASEANDASVTEEEMTDGDVTLEGDSTDDASSQENESEETDTSGQNHGKKQTGESGNDLPQSDEGILSGQTDKDDTSESEDEGKFSGLSIGTQTAEQKLSRKLLKENENVFYSPYSLFRVLMLLDNAETGKAKEELERVFAVSDLEKVNEQFNAYDAVAKENEKDVILETADSLWISEGIKLENGAEDYKKLLQESYSGDIFTVDFTKDAAKESINAWVSEKTEGMIDPFLEDLSVETDLALVDAVYFEGKWVFPFKEELTEKRSFYGSKGETQTDMMSMHSESFKVVEQGEIIGVELPYQGNRFVMDVYTSENGDILQLFHALSEKERDALFQSFDTAVEKQNLDRLMLPKFSFEYTVDGLDDYLKTLGLKSMYESGYLKPLNESLYVDSVIQKAKVEVDEQGTKAAAASGVMMNEMAMMPSGVELVVDQPFIFIIRDQINDVILFVGSVQNL